MNWRRKETVGACTLYLADSADVADIASGAQVVVTDPPYGVMLGEVSTGASREKGQIPYKSFSDTPEYVREVIAPTVSKYVKACGRGLVTPGSRNAFAYDNPDDIGVWYNPAGTGRGKWGFSLVVTPILYYGKDPRAGKRSTASSVWALNDPVSEIKNRLHPCPKPLRFMKWAVEKASLEGETVIDPFMGSGTTAVACVALGRPFIGIEIEEAYFDLAVQRIRNAYAQPDMFVQREPPATQDAFAWASTTP